MTIPLTGQIRLFYLTHVGTFLYYSPSNQMLFQYFSVRRTNLLALDSLQALDFDSNHCKWRLEEISFNQASQKGALN